MPRRIPLTNEKIRQGMQALSDALPTDAGLPLPLRVIIIGGAVSVMHFRTRIVTDDVDFWIPDVLPNPNGIQGHAAAAAGEAILHYSGLQAKKTGLTEGWINSAVSGFCTGNRQLIERSVQQNLILWRSEKLIFYAGDWTFQLIQKLARISTTMMVKKNVRKVDIEDAATLARQIVGDRSNAQLISFEDMQATYPEIAEEHICLAFAPVERYALSHLNIKILKPPNQTLLDHFTNAIESEDDEDDESESDRDQN